MMKKKLLLLFLFACIITTTSCKKEVEALTGSEFDLTAAKAEIEERKDIFEEALNSRDSVGLANCYTAEAKLMQPNAATVQGRANIQKLFGMWMKGSIMQIKIDLLDVWGNENMLVAENKWSFMNQSGKTVDTGKSLEVYIKEDDVWKLHRDCYNSDLPPAPAEK